MKIEKIQLINAPLSEDYYEISRSGVYPPLNLISLATYLQYYMPSLEIEILDGDILSQEEILSRINADIVGISPKILTYKNSLEIAKAAKGKGAVVIMGGAHATALKEAILKNREYIDAIVEGDGEKAFLEIVKGMDWRRIRNLSYRENALIRTNHMEELNLNDLPIQDNGFIDLNLYFTNFNKKFLHTHFNKAISIYSRKGCSWQTKNGGCIFCRKFDSRLRVRKSELVWHEIQSLVKGYEIDFVWDVSDNFTSSKSWLKQFVGVKPKRISPNFLVYGRSDEINEEIAQLLQKLNCYEVLVGVESGDDGMLRKANKGVTVKANLNAAKILKRYGIYLYPSFVLGLPGETKITAQKTLKLGEQLVEIGNVYQLACSTLIPLPQSTSFELILNHPNLSKKYKNQDLIPVEELRQDWVKYFCKVEYEYLEEIIGKILDLVPIKSSFGLLKEPSENRVPIAISQTLKPPPEIKGLNFTLEEKKEAREHNKMLLLTVFTKMSCNFNCPYCFTAKWASEKETQKLLTLEKHEEVFREAKELGVRSVWWVGLGEPLLWKYFLEFIELISLTGLVPLVFTNGSILTEEIVKKLFDLGTSVYIKLNSFNPRTQDELVGNIKGAHSKIQIGLKHLLKAGFNKTNPSRMAIQSVITKKNLADIPKLFRWARHRNIVPFFEIIVHTRFPISQEVQDIDLTIEEMKIIFEELLKIDEKEFGYTWIPTPPYVGKQCDKYYYALTIDAYGDILSCAASQVPVGNVREKKLKELWNDPFLKKIRRMDEFIEGKCKTCEVDCTGCRAEAFALTGNVFSEYKRCWR